MAAAGAQAVSWPRWPARTWAWIVASIVGVLGLLELLHLRSIRRRQLAELDTIRAAREAERLHGERLEFAHAIETEGRRRAEAKHAAAMVPIEAAGHAIDAAQAKGDAALAAEVDATFGGRP